MSGYGISGFDDCPKCGGGQFNMVGPYLSGEDVTAAVASGHQGTAQLFGQALPFNSIDNYSPDWRYLIPDGFESAGIIHASPDAVMLWLRDLSQPEDTYYFAFADLSDAPEPLSLVLVEDRGEPVGDGDTLPGNPGLGNPIYFGQWFAEGFRPTAPNGYVRFLTDHRIPRPVFSQAFLGRVPEPESLLPAPGTGQEVGGALYYFSKQVLWSISTDNGVRVVQPSLSGATLAEIVAAQSGGIFYAHTLAAEDFRSAGAIRLNAEVVSRSSAFAGFEDVTLDLSHTVADGLISEGSHFGVVSAANELLTTDTFRVTKRMAVPFGASDAEAINLFMQRFGSPESDYDSALIPVVSQHSKSSRGDVLTFVDLYSYSDLIGVTGNFPQRSPDRRAFFNGELVYHSQAANWRDQFNPQWEILDGATCEGASEAVAALTMRRLIQQASDPNDEVYEVACVLIDADRKPIWTYTADALLPGSQAQVFNRAYNQTLFGGFAVADGLWASHDGKRQWEARSGVGTSCGLKAELPLTLPITAGNPAPDPDLGIFG